MIRSLIFLGKKTGFFWFFFSLACMPLMAAQEEESLPFERSQSRYTFAQMYLGYEFSQFNLGLPGVEDFDKTVDAHALTLGGWHFWGMADFFVSFPIQEKKISVDGQDHFFNAGVNTLFRWYPFPIKNDKFRPFIGTGFGIFSYKQDGGPTSYHITQPVSVGLSLANSKFQLEFGYRGFANSKFDYSVSSTQKETLDLGGGTWFAGIKRVVDTTLQLKRHGLKPQASGFYPFFGVGPSAAWIMDTEQSYFDENAPWIDNDVSLNTMPEISLGVHWKPTANYQHRTLFQVAKRQFSYKLRGHDSRYTLRYDSYAFEVAQTLFDYYGFVPFVGVSYNRVDLSVSGDIDLAESQDIWGVLVGWDILPAGTSFNWTLRTNLRWYPEVSLETETGDNIAFPNFEFNFIQWVYQFEKFSGF